MIALSDATASAQSDIQLFYSPAKDLGKTGVSKNLMAIGPAISDIETFLEIQFDFKLSCEALGETVQRLDDMRTKNN